VACGSSGTLRDAHGAPVGNVQLVCTTSGAATPPCGRRRGETFLATAQTGADGHFALDVPVLPGIGSIHLPESLLLQAPRSLVVAGETAFQEVDLVVRVLDPAQAITGMVLDDLGRPLQSVSVRPVEVGGSETLPSTRTDDRGEFRLYCTGDPARKVTLELQHADTVPAAQPAPEVAWGQSGLRLVLARKPKSAAEPTAEVLVQVVDADGHPVEEFAVRCCADPRACSRFSTEAGALRCAGRHADGRLPLTVSTRWRSVLFVEPDSPRWLPAGPVFCDARAGTVRVVLREPGELRVHVVHKDGTPVADTQVELLHPWHTEAVRQETEVVALRDPFGRFQVAPWSVLLSEARTDQGGTATLTARCGEDGLVLRLPGTRHRPLLQAGVATPCAGPPRVFTVDSGATLVGTLRGWDRLQAYDTRKTLLLPLAAGGANPDLFRPTLVLCLPNTRQFFYIPHLFPRHDVADDGSFRMEGLLPGTWSVHLFAQVSSAGAPARLGPALATVTLADGESRTLELDGNALVPGRIHGRLLLDGKPMAFARSCVGLEGGDLGAALFTTPTDADGRFALEPAIPGRYRLTTSWQHPTTGRDLQLESEPFEVLPGATAEPTVSLDSSKGIDFMQRVLDLQRARR